jgi:hypothetical protein
MNKVLVTLVSFLIFMVEPDVTAQNAITTSGGNASGAGGSVSSTVGQIGYSSYSGTGGKVNAGVQQPFEISVLTAIKNTENISLEFVVYPNPVTDNLTLKFTGTIPSQCNAYMYDVNGSLLITRKVDGNETLISVEKLLPGTYLLKISENNKEIKTFKIIKH